MRQFKITLEFTISVNDITPERIMKDLYPESNHQKLIYDPELWAIAEPEKRLLHALLKNEDLLRRYVKKHFMGDMDYGIDQHVDIIRNALDIDDEEDEILLSPIFSDLSQEDVEWINESIRNESFSDKTEHFFSSFKTHLTKVTTNGW